MQMSMDIASLLESPEGETLDFKARSYDFSDMRKKRDFAKDIASLANTPREGDAYIVLGVKKMLDGSFQLLGMDKDIDDTDLQGIASSLLEPTPRFVYHAIQHGGVVLGLISISVGQQSPSVPKNTKDDGFIKDRIYFRRGSKNDVASMQEQGRIWEWIRNGGTVPSVASNPYALEQPWKRYLAETDQLRAMARHILIVDDRFRDDADRLSGIGAGPWSYVFDFDTQSDEKGLLASTRDAVERHRALHIRVKDDPHASRSPDFTTTWFFVRGLEGRVESIPTDGIRGWRRAYRQVLSDECGQLAAELTPATVYVTILWRDEEFNKHLAEVLRSLDDSLHDTFRPVFVTDAPSACQSLAEEFDAPVIEMPLHQFGLGLLQVAGTRQLGGDDTIALPSSSGVPISLEPRVANWIAEEIELVPLGSPKTEDIGAFLRGGTVTWADLDRSIDARRDVQTRLTEAVRNDLDTGRITRINLFHRPGAGGTTVARRVAWELHEEFSCGLLKRTVPMETLDRVARIYEVTGRPVLLIADGADIAERELDELAEYLGARRTPVLLVHVRRRQEAQQQGDRSFDLQSELSTGEVGRFVNTLSRDVPDRAAAIEQLGKPDGHALHRPVYFALTAYERDFLALPEFVSSRIVGLGDDQRRVVVYAAIALRYGQRALPASALRAIFRLQPRDRIDLPSLLPPTTNELFIENTSGEWRIGHSLVAEELLKQLLTAGGDIRTWRNRLADWGVHFIEFCRGNLPVPSNEMLEMVRRVFVYRDDVDVLGQEQSGQRRFSQFIEDIRVSEGRLRVLNALVESYPDEHHFWAHVARFHAMDRKDFTQALEAADHAVRLADHDSVVYHVRGMVRRHQLRELQQSDTALGGLVEVAERASSDFEHSRNLNPENEHGYIAEAQMLIELLEQVGRTSSDLFEFLSRRDVPPYLREALDRVEGLLAHVKRDREGIGASQYEIRASAKAHSLYGDYSGAIQRLDSLLTRTDIYQPPVRRQLAWAYLARAEGDWSRVPKRNLERVVELLAKNLEEESLLDQSVRLWMQASRFQENPPSVESIFEQVQYWRAKPGSIDAAYYAYVLNALMALDGSHRALQRYEQYLEECRELTRFRRNRSRSYEWLGNGNGIARLVHQAQLGDWNRAFEFWQNPALLARVPGRVARINGPQAGLIELAGGLEAFFVPGRSGLSRGSENTPVLAFLGFSYDGPRAWDVSPDAN